MTTSTPPSPVVDLVVDTVADPRDAIAEPTATDGATDTAVDRTHGPLQLRDDALGALPDGEEPPGHDRSQLVPSVVHVGVGGFHRSHQAVYFDDLARTGKTGWGITGVGLHRSEISEILDAQDGLHLLVSRDGNGESARVIGILSGHLHAPDAESAVLDALTDERTRLVTMTITGGGYLVDADTGDFDSEGEGVRDDIAGPHEPQTVFGYVVEALARRRRAGAAPFTVLSCDNVPRNGHIARTAVVSSPRRSPSGSSRTRSATADRRWTASACSSWTTSGRTRR